jgi:hypothetical protein
MTLVNGSLMRCVAIASGCWDLRHLVTPTAAHLSRTWGRHAWYVYTTLLLQMGITGVGCLCNKHSCTACIESLRHESGSGNPQPHPCFERCVLA